MLRNKELYILLGNFNATVGKAVDVDDVIGMFWLFPVRAD